MTRLRYGPGGLYLSITAHLVEKTRLRGQKNPETSKKFQLDIEKLKIHEKSIF